MQIRTRLGILRPALFALLPAVVLGAILVVGAWLSGPTSTTDRVESLDRVRPSTWYEAGEVSVRIDSLYLCEDYSGAPFFCIDLALTNHGDEPIPGTRLSLPTEEEFQHIVTFGYAHGTPADADGPDYVDYADLPNTSRAWVNPSMTEELTLRWDLYGEDLTEYIGMPERVFIGSTELIDIPDRPMSPYWDIPEASAMVIVELEGPR